MSVKRYGFWQDGNSQIVECLDGLYVEFTDYAALEAEHTKLKDLYKKMTESRDEWRDMYVERGRQHEA